MMENFLLKVARDDMGVYPKATIKDGVTIPRTDWQEGFNAYGDELLTKWELLDVWYDSLNSSIRNAIKELIIYDVISLVIIQNKTIIYINLNDIFLSASDCEEIKIEDILNLFDIWEEYDFDGVIAWVAFNRKTKPLKEFRSKVYKKAMKYIKRNAN